MYFVRVLIEIILESLSAERKVRKIFGTEDMVKIPLDCFSEGGNSSGISQFFTATMG